MSGSRARRSSAGSRPTVDNVTRRGDTVEAVFVRQDPQRLHRLVVVVQRLAHAHQDDVEPLVAHGERVGEHADLADDLAGGQVPRQPHLAGEAEGAGHGAADLGRDAEGHRRRVGDEDRLDHVAVGEAQEEFLGAVNGTFALDDLGRRQREAGGERRAEALRQVGHLVERGDAVAVDPAENLARAEALEPPLLERGFERRALELGEVLRSGGIGRRYLIRFQRFAASAILSRKETRPFFAPGTCSDRTARAIVNPSL